MSLDTLVNVKLRLGITTAADDALLALLMDSADEWVAGYCGRDFGGGTFTEYHPAGGAVVFLRNYPVQAVTSVKVDPVYGFGAETTVPTTAYVVHADRGVVQSLAGPFLPCLPGLAVCGLPPWALGPRAVQVVYSTATGAVPADVKEAYALLVGHWYRHVKTQVASAFQNVTQQTFGDATAIFSKDQIAGLPLPEDIPRLLGPYRTPLV
jgi:uncharacterized phiE125 gp8 family phage protein